MAPADPTGEPRTAIAATAATDMARRLCDARVTIAIVPDLFRRDLTESAAGRIPCGHQEALRTFGIVWAPRSNGRRGAEAAAGRIRPSPLARPFSLEALLSSRRPGAHDAAS